MQVASLRVVEKGDYMKFTGEPFHKVGRESVIIDMPTPDIILDASFDYGRYVDDYFRDAIAYRNGIYQGYFEDCDAIDLNEILSGENIPVKEDLKEELYDDYHTKMSALQNQYEKAYREGCVEEVGFEITMAMQVLTAEYNLKKESMEEEKRLQELEEINSVMSEALREARRQQIIFEENQSEERVAAYRTGELPLSELTLRDLSKLPTHKKVVDISRYIHARITDSMVKDYDIFNMKLKDTVKLIDPLEPSSKKR